MALVCLCRGNFYWPPHTTILFCSIFLDKIVLDTLKSRYHRSAPLGIPLHEVQLLRCITKPQVHTGLFGIIGICQHQIFLAPLQQVSGGVLNPELIRNGHPHFDTHSSSVIPNCLISDQYNDLRVSIALSMASREINHTSPLVILRANQPSPFPVCRQSIIAEY